MKTLLILTGIAITILLYPALERSRYNSGFSAGVIAGREFALQEEIDAAYQKGLSDCQ